MEENQTHTETQTMAVDATAVETTSSGVKVPKMLLRELMIAANFDQTDPTLEHLQRLTIVEDMIADVFKVKNKDKLGAYLDSPAAVTVLQEDAEIVPTMSLAEAVGAVADAAAQIRLPDGRAMFQGGARLRLKRFAEALKAASN